MTRVDQPVAEALRFTLRLCDLRLAEARTNDPSASERRFLLPVSTG